LAGVPTSLPCAGRRALRILGTRRLLVRLSPGRWPCFCIWLCRQHHLPVRRALVRVRGRYRTHVRRAEWRVDQCGIYCTAWLPPLRPVIYLCSGVSIPLLGRHALYSFGGCILSRDTLLERMLSAAHQGLLRRASIPGEIGLCGTLRSVALCPSIKSTYCAGIASLSIIDRRVVDHCACHPHGRFNWLYTLPSPAWKVPR